MGEGSIKGLRARTNASVDIEWNSDKVFFSVTSNKTQAIVISVYGGEKQNISFNAGETKVIELKR